jgi:hypothetical protein
VFSCHLRTSLLRVLGALSIGVSCTGCSFIFVNGPPEHVEQPVAHSHADCTSGKAAPIIDSIITGYELIRTAYAATASSRSYSGAPLSREADITLGAGFAGLFLASSIYGFVSTSRCSRLKHGPNPDEQVTGMDEAPAPPPTPAKSSIEQQWDASRPLPNAPPAPAASAAAPPPAAAPLVPWPSEAPPPAPPSSPASPAPPAGPSAAPSSAPLPPPPAPPGGAAFPP